MKKEHVFIAMILLIVFQASWGAVTIARHHNSYVSDEVWYVSAARNLLYKMGITVHYTQDGREGVNVFVNTDPTQAADYIYNILTLNNISGFSIMVENKADDVYLMIPKNEFSQAVNILKKAPFVSKVIPGFYYPNQPYINSYYNTEHPALAKELIMVSMIIFGDSPFSWRIPAILLYTVMLILVALTVRNFTGSYAAGIVALLLTASSYSLRCIGATAMLEIFVATFFMLALWSYSRGDTLGTYVGIALTLATKFTLAFPAILLWYYVVRNKQKLEILGSIVGIGVLFVAFNLSAIYAVGFTSWAHQLADSFFWHLGPKGYQPQETSVFSWFTGYALWFMGPRVYYAIPQAVFWIVLLFTIRLLRDKTYLMLSGLYFIGVTYFAYLYAAGSTTQFAYYYAALAPLGYMLVAIGLEKVGALDLEVHSLRTATNKFKATIGNFLNEKTNSLGGVVYEAGSKGDSEEDKVVELAPQRD